MSLIRVLAAPGRKVPILGRGIAPCEGPGIEVEPTREVMIHLGSGDLVLIAVAAPDPAPTPKKESAP